MQPERLELAEAYRQTQIRVRAQALRDSMVFWQTIDPDNFDETWARTLDSVRDIIASQYDRSVDLAEAYYQTNRRLAGLGTLSDVPRPVRLNVDRLTTSLRVTGPVAWRQAIGAGRNPDQAFEVMLVRQSGAAGRHVMSGGRERVEQIMSADPQATKYLRTTDGDPCAFCALLAGRGAVYKSRNSFKASDARFTGGGSFKVHDHCGCNMVPGFGADPDHLDRNARFKQMYDTYAEGSGAERLTSFRRAYRQQTS